MEACVCGGGCLESVNKKFPSLLHVTCRSARFLSLCMCDHLYVIVRQGAFVNGHTCPPAMLPLDSSVFTPSPSKTSEEDVSCQDVLI
jgi:hypothetical protein